MYTREILPPIASPVENGNPIIGTWNRAFEKAQIDPFSYTGGRNLSENFSWDFIDIGVSKDFLLRER